MKQSQWLFAVLVLAGMVFIVTFAMNYLGGSPRHQPNGTPPPGPRRELTFAYKIFPPDGFSRIDQETKTSGHGDFWFQNSYDTPLKVGLVRGNCKCTKVWVYLLPDDAIHRVIGDATALLGVSPAGPWQVLALQGAALPEMEKGAKGTEILKDKEAVDVPANSLGWVRLDYNGEKAGPQQLEALLWADSKEGGQLMHLAMGVAFHDPLRVKPLLAMGQLKDSELAAGVTRYLYAWSPTRPKLKLEAKSSLPRADANSDPFEIGAPEPLSEAELQALVREIPNMPAESIDAVPSGLVQSAYRIPVTLRAVAKDGKTPFDVGPFRRRVVISCPDLDFEAKSVLVMGQVHGVVDLGTDESAGEINFRVFSRTQGKRETMTLNSDEPGLQLEVDRTRSWEYLDAKLIKGKAIGNRQTWTLRVEMLPKKASGNFPRKDDPTYEDCAVYLNATVPGGKLPPRPIRIAVQGTAGG